MTYSEKIELLSGLADLTQTILKLTRIVANCQPDGAKPVVPDSQIRTLEDLKKASPAEKISVVKDFLQTYLDSDDDPVDDDKDDEPIKTETHKPVKVVNMLPFELKQFAPYGSDIRCTRPTKDREYVRILAACRGKFVTIFQVFPGIKNPDRYELITLQKLGYLERYTQPEYVTRWSDKGGVLAARKVWFKTTPKGEELLRKVGV